MRQALTSEEQMLIDELKSFLKNPENVDKWAAGQPRIDARPPLPEKDFDEAIQALGFPVPPLFRALYTQVGNGGYGPGIGLYRLTGAPRPHEAILSSYRLLTGPELPPEYGSWHPDHLLLADWGCNIYSAIDCSTAEGAIFLYRMDRFGDGESGPVRDFGVLEADSLREWLERWMRGEYMSGQSGDPEQTG